MRIRDPKFFLPWIRDGKIRILDPGLTPGSATSVVEPEPEP